MTSEIQGIEIKDTLTSGPRSNHSNSAISSRLQLNNKNPLSG